MYCNLWRYGTQVAGKEKERQDEPSSLIQTQSSTASPQATCWEGAIEVNGVARDTRVTGQGYMELTGYAEGFKEKL